jgi:peptidoglycan glycosyltransferase/penicillin-binding protein 2
LRTLDRLYKQYEQLPGPAGLEKVYDDILQKQSSEDQLVTVLDARGMAIHGLMFKILQDQTSEQGSVVLTIDRRVQQITEEVIDQSMVKGAVVVLDIKTREILAMASRPTFNQNDIEPAMQRSDTSPFLNRALNAYHPGSLFKILLAAAALSENKVSVADQFLCNGKIEINQQVTIKCWKEEGHGLVTFDNAFANSCNPAFIETGLKLGRADLLKYARQMKITDPTVIGYPNCQTASFVKLIPDGCSGKCQYRAAGVMVTPMQLTSLIATIADNGWYKSPSLVKYTIDSKGNRQDIRPAGVKEFWMLRLRKQYKN